MGAAKLVVVVGAVGELLLLLVALEYTTTSNLERLDGGRTALGCEDAVDIWMSISRARIWNLDYSTTVLCPVVVVGSGGIGRSSHTLSI